MDSKVYSITLAAGVGRRMPPDMPPKPCCKIGPVSVIENALQAYEEAGIDRHVVVVGRRAEEIIREVSATGRAVLFAYQREPLGTGDAVRCALDLLARLDPPAHVLISSGDKVIAPRVIRGIVESYAADDMDLCLVAGPGDQYPGAGHIVMRGGRIAAILETPDIRVRQLAARLKGMSEQEWPQKIGDLRELAGEYLPIPGKLQACFPVLGEVLEGADEDPVPRERVLSAAEEIPKDFRLQNGSVSVEEAASAELCNLSVYIGRFGSLRLAVDRLGTENVQGECYFTDAVDVLVSSGCNVGVFRIQDPEEVMAFNTLEELEAVRRVHAVRVQKRVRYPKLEAWNRRFTQIGSNTPAAQAVKHLAAKIGPERSCILVHSPGRINLMGRHVDHQGGTCNLLAINREIVMAASPRDDDRINLWNLKSGDYPPRSFTFEELTADVIWEDWLRTLDSQYLRRMVSDSPGEWDNYAKGAALRMQHRFPDRRLRGMDAFVVGNIPVGAGLSSSSALVVAVAEALTEVNALNLRPRELVDLCGEGEWFVGTRGGSADHAAIKFGRENEVVSVSFFPFEILGGHPFPPDVSLLICHSGISAKKTENARERFNARVACYHMAREIIRREFPALAARIHHLRDVNAANLDLSVAGLYGLLKRLPESVSPEQVEAMAAEHPTVEKCVAAIDTSRHDFPLRDVALFGLAECDRSARTARLLDEGDMVGLGRMMNISHDGDRVARWRPDQSPFTSRATDRAMDELAARAAEAVPLTESGAALWQQPGAYGCSTAKIDMMVDRVLACPDVLGAQLAGAGLGGCIMVLLEKSAVDHVREVLVREYYEPEGLEESVIVCEPSQGSRVLTSVEAAN